MAARVTKLFLQNCLEARSTAVGKAKASGIGAKGGKLASGSASVKVQPSKKTRRRKNKANKSGVRFLEAAQQEQKQSDKTKENLRKLKTRANEKSQRLMAKALEKRQAMRL